MSHNKLTSNPNYTFNPFEIAFCGYSQSGKTTLITRLIKELSGEYKIGYIKHDVHSVDMDREGKDTYLARENGAKMVFINDPNQFVHIHDGKVDPIAQQSVFLENDFVFVEGYKDSIIPKILFIDKKEEIFKDIQNKRFQNVIAYAGSQRNQKNLPADIPYFHYDDIDKIKQFVLSYFQQQAKNIPIYGLVLTGGRSTRMKRDKSLLQYHDKKQSVHCSELLSKFCDQTFISVREGQEVCRENKIAPEICDKFIDIGPLGGILTAMTKYPAVAWLVLACDLPFVDKELLEELIKERNSFKIATAYRSTKEPYLPEPLCAIYEPKGIFRFLQFLGRGVNCPRKILMESDIYLIEQKREFTLDNVNNPQEYQKAVNILNNNRKEVVN